MRLIESVIQALSSEYASYGKISVACISTTNPVYLVFRDGYSKPELVVRRADSRDVIDAHEITEKIYGVVGDLVPEPVAVVSVDGLDFAVQKGVAGLPWFQISGEYSSEVEWAKLRSRAINALNELHSGSARVAGWSGKCEPGQVLRESLRKFLTTGTIVSTENISYIEKAAAVLDGIGEIESYPQHGDFCLNNLIVNDKKMHVIDFEDFGITQLPLYDEFTLALSLAEQAGANVNTSIAREIAECTQDKAETLGIDREMIPALLLCHLLIRLGEWSLGDSRKEYRQKLMHLFEDLISMPKKFFEQ